MKIACVLTTINVPTVLEAYRACSPAHLDPIKFFVIGDMKSDDHKTQEFVNRLADTEYFSYDRQQSPGLATNSLLPANCIQRRNLGFLLALKWGADAIVSIDDDNIVFDKSYFTYHRHALQYPVTGLMFEGGKSAWFDAGRLLQPQAKHRGIPYDAITGGIMRHAVGAKVGVSAGLCLGDPDIDATTRMVNHPLVGDTNAVGRAGIVVHPNTWTVFNSQNTAVIRELIPAWGMVPHVGRFDDIFASLVVQRVARDRDLHVRFGQPCVWQHRNSHDLVKDLRGEIEGYATIRAFAALLDQVKLPNKSVVADCRIIWDTVRASSIMPLETAPAMSAYLADCEQVLKA